MIAFAVACIVAVVAIAMSMARLGRAGRDDGVAGVLQSLRLGAALEGSAPARVAARAVLAAPSERAAIGELNEHLTEVEGELALGREIPRSAARIALATGTVCAVLEIAQSLQQTGAPSPWSIASFAAGACGFLVSLVIGREAEARSVRRREAWNRASQELLRHRGGASSGRNLDRDGQGG